MPSSAPESPQLTRGIGLLGATSANMLEMIGVGPFLTIPLLLSKMNGPQAMLGWLLGAAVALADGMVWAELGAAMPGTGGPYRYLSEAYGPTRLGRLMSFLFIWETVLLAPISIASGAVGFAQYAHFLAKNMGWWQEKLTAMTVCGLITVLLYRDIRTIGKLSVVMWLGVLATVAWITGAGLLHFNPSVAFDFPAGAFTPSRAFFWGLGGATLIAMYDYGGYNNVCFFAGEVKRPERVVPRSILLSITAVGLIYLTMNVTILGVVPWREAIRSTSIVSDFIQRLYGATAANIVTVMVLWTTFASLFAVLLGYSRVPYAAAVEGRFFQRFARLHPTGNFPSFSLVFFGVVAGFACLLNLDVLINALIVIQVLIQFLAQVVAVTLIRRNRPDIARPFHMPLYPFTCIVAFAGWLYILVASGVEYIVAGVVMLALGVGAYLWRARGTGEWPFELEGSRMTPVDVLVAGEIFADLIMGGFAGWPKPGEEAFATDFRRDIGGAAITACGLAALGTRAGLMGVIGQEQQEWMLARLRGHGVETAQVRVEQGEASGITVAITSPQDRTFFTYPGVNRRFADLLIQAARQGLEVERHVHLACAPDWDTAPELFRLIRRNGCTLSLDAGWHEDWLRDPRALPVLAEIDLFFPSLPEAAALTGENEPERILRSFRAAGVRHVALKMGARGSALLWDGALYFANPHPVTPRDPTGAGDAFDAGFLDAWLRGFPAPVCLSSANICGALATEGLGGIEALPTGQRLAEELERES